MAEASARTSRWRRWTLGLPAAVLLVLVVALGVVHTPVVRRIVLRRAIVTLQDRLHLRLTAASLSYNLLALRISLADVVLAGETTADLPFAHAARVSVDLPWSSLLGRFAIDDVVLADAAVHVVRRRDGTTNLPKSGDTEGTPSALPVGRIRILDLRVDISDEPSSVELSFPRIAVDVAREKGSVRLLGEGTIARVRHATRVQQLEGDVAFDGRALRFDRLRLAMDEGSMTAQGTLALLVDTPSVDANIQGTVDTQRVMAWFENGASVAGAVTLRGHVNGPLSAPKVSTHIESKAIVADALTLSDVASDIDADSGHVRIARAEARVAAGRVAASGVYDVDAGRLDAAAEWSGIDTARLVRTLAPQARLYPSGMSSGKAHVRASLSDVPAGDLAAYNETSPGAAGRDLVPARGTIHVGVADKRWTAVARYDVLAAHVDADLGGRVNATALQDSTVSGRVRMTARELTPVLRALGSAGLMTSDAPAVSGSADADVRLAGTLRVPSMDVSLNARNLDAGDIRSLSASGTAKGTLRELAVDVAVAQTDTNTIRAVGLVSPSRRTLNVAVTGTIADLHALAPDVPVSGALQLNAQTNGAFDAPRAQGTVTIADARYDTFAIGRVDSTIEIDGTQARVQATAPDLGARAQGAVMLAAPHAAEVDVTIDNVDLARLTRDQINRLAIAGRASMRAHAAGPIDNWRSGTASIDVSSFDARANELSVRLSRPAAISYQDRRLRFQPTDIELGEAHASVSGSIPIEAGVPNLDADDLIAVVTGDSRDVLEAVKAIGLVDVPAIEANGPIELQARASGSIARPVIDGDLMLGPASIAVNDVPAATNVDVRLAVEGGWLELRGLTGTWQGSAVSARARVPLRFFDRYLPEAISKALPATTGPASLIARADALTPQVLEPFVDPETLAQLKGTVGVAADFQSDTATIEDLRGELRVDRLDVEIGGLPVRQREPTRIVADHGFARVAAWNWDGQGATLAVKGQVRLADRQAGILADGRIDLRTLSPFVRAAGVSTAGTLEPHVSITGAIENPRIDGDVALTNGEVRLAEPRVAVTDLTGRAVLSLNGARITSLRGGINGGTLTGTGQVDYRRNEAVTATMALNVHDAALEFPEGLRSAVDADLALNYVGGAPAVKGPLDVAEPAHGALSGTVTVAHSSYRQPLALATGLLSALRNRRVAAAAQPEQDALASHLALDVRVLTEDDVVVDNNYGRLQMGADLRVIGTAAAPALSGRAELREGGQLFLGRNIYTIDTGTIDFANPVTIEPELNIVATTRAGGEEIELPIKGTPDNLDMSPRSLTTPELGTADVWSVLLTGRRLDEISGDEAQVVGEQVLSYLSGDVLGMASRAVGLDTIRLGGLDRTTLRTDPTAVVAEIDPTSRMTFGKSIGRDVDLTFSQSLRESDAQTWIVDYRPARQLELRLVSDDDNLRSYEFRHDVPFGARARGSAGMPVVRRRSTAPRVAAAEFTGTLAVPEQQLRARLHVKEGDRLDYAEWQRDRDRIESFYWSEGRLEARISAKTRETNDAVTLAYEIEAGPATSVVVTGATLARETLAVLRDAWAHSVFDGFLQDEARDVVRRAMAEDGYLRAEVTAAVSAGNGEKTLTVTVSPGDRTTERRIRVTAAGVENADIERWMRNQRLDVAVWREPGRVQRDIEAHLRADGHLRTAVKVGAVMFEGSAATVPIEVDTGPVFTIGRVALRGAGRLSEADVIGASSLASGMIHDPAAIESARQRIVALYRREGFASVKVTASAQARTDVPQVDVTFDVVEAPRQVLGEIVVEGNRAIEQDVVVRAMRLETNEPLGIDAWLQARKRVFDTGLFRRVDVSTEPTGVSGDAGVQPMRVRVVVEEWPPLRFRYGIKVAEERSTTDINGRNLTPGLSAEVTRRTLFGRAITVGGAGVYQHRQRNARGFIGAPTFWGAPIQSSLTLERSHEDIASVTLVTDRNRAAWEQRMTFTPRLQLSYSYGFERNHTFDTSPPANSFLPAFDISINIARLNGAAAFDTRNDPTETTRGSLVTGSVEYTPQALGSDIWFVKFVGQAYHFRPWKRLVFASAARVGAMRPLGGQELLTSERFFTGGARSVRGVDEDSLGPQNVFDEPSGGGALLVLNQEVRFPVFKWLRGVGFLDAGNVFAAPSDLRVTDLVGSGGMGARLTTPFGTFRVDYGKRWSSGAGRWTFGIGQTF